MSEEEAAKKGYERKHRPGIKLLGESARLRREILGLTQEDLSEKFGGPSVASLRTIENAQSDKFRAKTLASLDSSLGWPRGTSPLLLTGDTDVLANNSASWTTGGFRHQEGVVKKLLTSASPFGVSHESFDEFVDYIVTAISYEEQEAFDMPVRGYASSGTPTVEDRDNSEELNLDASAREKITQLSQLLRRALNLFTPYMDLLDSSQSGLDKVRINAEVLARLAEHEDDLPPTIQGAINDLRATVADYAKVQLSHGDWVRIAREMAAVGGDIEDALGDDDGER